MSFIVATNVVASRRPERRLAGTSSARAKICRPLTSWANAKVKFHFPVKFDVYYIGNNFVQKQNFGVKKILGSKQYWVKQKFESTKFWGQKKLWVKEKCWHQKF